MKKSCSLYEERHMHRSRGEALLWIMKLMVLFLTNTQHFTSQDVIDALELLVDYCDVFISCLDSYSDSTIHCRGSIGEKMMQICSDEENEEERWRQLKKLVYILDGQRVNTYSFWWTIPLKHILSADPIQKSWLCICLQGWTLYLSTLDTLCWDFTFLSAGRCVIRTVTGKSFSRIYGVLHCGSSLPTCSSAKNSSSKSDAAGIFVSYKSLYFSLI